MSENTTTPIENGTEPERTFTQGDVDRIVSDRLKRERGKLETDAQAALEEREKALTRREVTNTAQERVKHLRLSLTAEQSEKLTAELSSYESLEDLERGLKLLEMAQNTGVPGTGSPVQPMPTSSAGIRGAMGLKT